MRRTVQSHFWIGPLAHNRDVIERALKTCFQVSLTKGLGPSKADTGDLLMFEGGEIKVRVERVSGDSRKRRRARWRGRVRRGVIVLHTTGGDFRLDPQDRIMAHVVRAPLGKKG